jgi:hypothetical protein
MTAVILPLVSTKQPWRAYTLIGEFSQDEYNLNGANGTTFGPEKNMK